MALAQLKPSNRDFSSRFADFTAKLEAVRSRLEKRFLRAGTTIASASAALESLIGSLDQLASAIENGETVQAYGALDAAADDLLSLPRIQADRRVMLEALAKKSSELEANIERLRTTLRYLRAFVLHLKVTAAEADEFKGFADELMERVNAGDRNLAVFNDKLSTLHGQLRDAFDIVQRFERECTIVVSDTVKDLGSCASAIQEHGRGISRLAGQISQLASQIHAKVGQALMAMQIGDNTRQRIEHIQAALEALGDAEANKALDAKVHAQRDNLVYHLALAQLSDAADHFAAEAKRVSENLLGLSDDARDVLRLKSMFGEGQTAVFLRNLESSVGKVQLIVDDVTRVNDNADKTGRSAAGTAETLLGDVEAIRSVKTDILYMSLNTSLRCCHMGAAGLPMNVIAVELRTTSDDLEVVSDNTVANLDQLAGLAARVVAGDPAGAKGARLDHAVQSIRGAADNAESSLVTVNKESMRVAEAVQSLSAYSDFHSDLCALLEQACQELAELTGERISEVQQDPAVDATLDKIFKSYSMSRERDVHRAIVGSGDAPVSEEKTSGADEDLFASALF